MIIDVVTVCMAEFNHDVALQDRAPMQQRYLSDYMAGLGGPPGMDGESSKAALLREVQDYVAGNKQVRVCR